MILRVTAKLGKKIGIFPAQSLLPDANPYADWTGRLFTAERVQYILLTNTPSLYSVVMYGRGITNDAQLVRGAMACLHTYMSLEGDEQLFGEFIEPAAAEVSFSKSLNRSVTGSMTDLVRLAKYRITEGSLPLLDISHELNETPMFALTERYPRRAFRALQGG